MKNNNYYIGLLAGALAVVTLQGSEGNEKIPGVGEQRTSTRQIASNSRITEALQTAASELAAAYDERANCDKNKSMRRLFRIRAKLLRITFGVENATELPLTDLYSPLGKIRQDYAKQLASYYIQNGNIEFARDLRNDFAWLIRGAKEIASMQFESNDDLKNYQLSNDRSGYGIHINNAPIRHSGDKNLYPKLQTQQIFGPDDHIVSGMYQYIIIYPVTKAEIVNWVTELNDKHNGKALKPIIFQAQKFDTCSRGSKLTPMQDGDNFEIKTYWVDINTGHPRQNNSKAYTDLRNPNKPLIFGKTQRDLEFSTGIKIEHYEREVTYQNYLQLVQTYGDDFYVEFVKISPNAMQALSQQIDTLMRSKNVGQIKIDFNMPVDVSQIPLEYLGCVKIREMSFSNYQNPNSELFLIRTDLGRLNNVKCKSIYCFGAPDGQKTFVNRVYDRIGGGTVRELQDSGSIYINHLTGELNTLIQQKERPYLQYIKRYDLEYLSGYVNIANQPRNLSDEEWHKVNILKEKAEEIKALMRYEPESIIIFQMR